jgi:hypothetical protein
MPISVSNNPLAGSFNVSGAAAAQRHSVPVASQQGLLLQPQPARLTLPARSESVSQRQSADLQQRQMAESNRQSSLFDRIELRNPDAESASDNGTEIRRVGTFNQTEVERLSSASSQSASNAPDAKAERKQHARLGLDLNNLRENAEKAKTVGVDVAKKTFWRKLVGVGISTVLTGLAVGVAISTGGVGLAVAAGIAGIMLAKNAADTHCAKQVMQNARAEAQGLPLPHKNLPMGADWLANQMHKVISRVKPDMSEEGKMRLAGNISKGVDLTLSVASIACGSVSAILEGKQGAELLLEVVPAAVMVANVGIIHLLEHFTDKKQAEAQLYADEQLVNRFIEVNEKYAENKADSSDHDKLLALDAGLASLESDVDALAARVEVKDLAYHSANTALTDDEDVAYASALLADPGTGSELLSATKYQHAIAEIEAAEADVLSTEVAKEAGAKGLGTAVLAAVGFIAVEKSVQAVVNAEIDPGDSIKGAVSTVLVGVSAYKLIKAGMALNEAKAPVTQHETNIADINRKFANNIAE